MIEILFFAFLISYVAISAKIYEWQTLTILQFKSSTPQGYITNSGAYHRACWVLFIGAAIVALNSEILKKGLNGLQIQYLQMRRFLKWLMT